MKIAMIGSGAAGSVFAAYLRKGGADLYLVDRYQAHMDAIAQNGLTFVSPAGEEVLTGFQTSPTAETIGIMDIVILMVKATQTDSVMPTVLPCIGPETVVVSLQNGLGNDEVLAKYLPEDRILCGFGTIGTELPAPGTCISKPESGIIMHFGASVKSEATDRAGQYLQDTFCKGGCEARYEENIKPFIWKKAISNSGYNTLSAVTRLKVGPLIADTFGQDLIWQVWKEGCEVAKADGAGDLWPELQKEMPRLAEGFATYYPSMAQDVLIHHRQTEISVLNGAIVRYGKKYGIPTPVNSVLTAVISCMQNNYDDQYKA